MKKVTALAALAVATIVIAVSPASAALPNQRTDLKVLLLSANGAEPTAAAWEAALKREGVPFEKKIATADEPYTADTFANTLADGTPHAKYQAVIIASGGLVYADEAGNWGSALSSEEWAALADFESRYGIRQITAFTWPSAEYGLNSPTVSGDLTGVVGNLTTAGTTVFAYLKGQVPIDKQTYGYQATPATGANFKTLVSGPNGSALLGINTRPDGREEMVSTVDQNQYMIHNQLLRHGMLAWVTKGTYLGTERNYLTVQVDDIFEASERWDPAANVETLVNPLRMTASDVLRAALWSRVQGFRLDMAYNGNGAVEAGSRDRLTQYFLAYKSLFYWINHTYTHANLDNSSLAELKSEIQKNIDWARANRLSIDPTELVTGEHSGLFNPNMVQALTETGIKWFGDDSSRRFDQWQLGPATSLPRYPTNVYYNAATRQEQLDEYNYLYLPPSLGGSCQNTATTTCFSQPATWNEYVDREAETMLRHVLANDPRPHYMHQANLAKDGTLYSVVGEALRRYRAYFKPSIVQPVHKQAGQLLDTQAKWNTVKNQVDAFIQNGQLNLSGVPSTVQVPITGIPGLGSLYGGLTSGWQQIGPGGTLQLKLPSERTERTRNVVLLDPLEKSQRAAGSNRPRVLLTTEGTYPHVIGGVSSWCDLLIGGLPEIHWQILPIVAARDGSGAVFQVPEHADLLDAIELWSPEPPPRRRRPSLTRVHSDLPSVLVRELIGWNETGALTDALVWCRRHPEGIRHAFRSRRGWERFLAVLHEILHEEVEDSAPAPELDTVEAATLYQTLYWIARTAAVPTPETDLLHVTAAGWAAVPAIVHKALWNTPMLLTEHGVYVREAYLAAARSRSGPGRRFIATRLARGLTLAAYESADVVAPVSEANARWESALGVDPARIHVIHNGVDAPGEPTQAPGAGRVIAVGRIDPLKDVHTMLRVAVEVTECLPDAQFMYYGPVTPGQEAYGRTCTELHEQLGLGDRFRFMGSTRDVPKMLREADVLLMTSISEGMPMGILEAMSLARPVVATAVGGVPEVLRGCGIVAPSGDVHGLAVAVTTLLGDPALANSLGRRGHATVGRKFTRSSCLDRYRHLIADMSAPRPRLVAA